MSRQTVCARSQRVSEPAKCYFSGTLELICVSVRDCTCFMTMYFYDIAMGFMGLFISRSGRTLTNQKVS